MNASVWISISGLGLYLAIWGYAQWQHRATKRIGQMKRATGSCLVSFEPEGLGRALISGDKEFQGALEASSKREVWHISEHDVGRAVYKHVERVVGTLDGRSGSFLMAYSGIKDDGTCFAVVSGSGTGALSGLSGTLTIRIRGGGQVYDFEYTLNQTKAPREGFLPHSLHGPADEPQRDTGRILRSVLPAISVFASQQIAVQRAGACALHLQKMFPR